MNLGDWITVAELNYSEGRETYLKMTDYANRMGYVVERKLVSVPVVDANGEEMNNELLCYQICESANLIPMTRKEELVSELNQINAWYDEHHYIAEKLAYGRATRDEYADVIAETEVKARRINEIRAELKLIEQEESEKKRAELASML